MRTLREDLNPPTITKAVIGPMPRNILDRAPQVTVTFTDGTSKKLFSFYPDEIMFEEKELIGMTEGQAHHLKYVKDMAYLQDRTTQESRSPYFNEVPADFVEEVEEEDMSEEELRYSHPTSKSSFSIYEL